MTENNIIINNDQLDEIVDTIKDSTSEQIIQMRDIHNQVENMEPVTEGDVEKATVYKDEISPENPYVTTDEEGYITTDMSLFDIAESDIQNLAEEEIKESVTKTAKDLYGLNDEDVMCLLHIVTEYRKKEGYPVWTNMSPGLRDFIKKSVADKGITPDKYPTIAKMMVETFIEEAETELSFIDIEKSLNEALDIPALSDLYSEHTDEVMNKKLPEMIEELKSIDPDKAQMLEDVRTSFNEGYSLSRIEQVYLNTTRVRKAVRRDYDKVKRYCDDLNYLNKKTKFMMNDANQMLTALIETFGETETEEVIKKVVILLCMSFENYDRYNLVDASYIYYTIKNIVMLQYTSENKTEFSLKLINNIQRIINMIKNEEEKFNEEQSGNRKNHKQKKSVRNRNSRSTRN